MLGELGKEPRELDAPGDGDTAEHVVTIEDAAPAKGIDPEPVGQRLLGLVRVAHQGKSPSLHRLDGELTDEPALADPGLTQHRDQLPSPRERLVQRVPQACELRLTTEHRRFVR